MWRGSGTWFGPWESSRYWSDMVEYCWISKSKVQLDIDVASLCFFVTTCVDWVVRHNFAHVHLQGAKSSFVSLFQSPVLKHNCLSESAQPEGKYDDHCVQKRMVYDISVCRNDRSEQVCVCVMYATLTCYLKPWDACLDPLHSGSLHFFVCISFHFRCRFWWNSPGKDCEVNTSRGGLIDNQALIGGLRSGRECSGVPCSPTPKFFPHLIHTKKYQNIRRQKCHKVVEQWFKFKGFIQIHNSSQIRLQ